MDVNRRLRQHNGELKGGARATHWGRPWIRLCHVQGFPNERTALQFEWKWKRLSTTGGRPQHVKRRQQVNTRKTKTRKTKSWKTKTRKTKTIAKTWETSTPFDKLSVGHPSLKKRLIGLWRLIHCERYTFKAPPASSIPLRIVWEDPTRVACRQALQGVLPPHVKLICK